MSAVICQRLYRWVSYVDTGRPQRYTTYYSWFPFATMVNALQDMRDHLPEGAPRDAYLHEACQEAGPTAVGLALGYLAMDHNKQRFYHVLQRDNLYDQHWNTWVSNVWFRPARPAQPIKDMVPPDARASFTDDWGMF